jgi:mitochondrial import inner membrane translocase subunit TIM21
MLLNFFVQGQPHQAVSPTSSDQSTFAAALERTKASAAALSEMSADEVVDSTKSYARDKWDSCKRLFKFLSGDPLPSSPSPPMPSVEPAQQKQPSGWMQGLTGLFSGLRPTHSETAGPLPAIPEEGYVDGEVHADLVMVCKQLRTCLSS